MKIFLFSLNYSPEPTGTGPYSGGLAEALAERGHDVTVFAAYPFYPDWKFLPGARYWRWSKEILNGVKVHRCPVYLPRKFTALTRMLHYGSFAISCVFPSVKALGSDKPDIAINVAPTLLSGPATLLSAKLSRAKTWLHIQDFEVEAGFATNQMAAQGLLARMAFRFEKFCIKAFDRVSSSSPEMCKKLVEKGCDPDAVYEFRNWSDVENIVPQDHSEYRDEWQLGDQKVALYSGSIAQKQGIEMLIEVARLLSDRHDILLIICGNGPNRKNLEQAATGVGNIIFHELQPKQRLNELLNLAKVHLLPQKADAADLLLPSKLTNILASGRPVVAGTAQGTGLAREMEGCGLAVKPENPLEMAAAIRQLVDDQEFWNKCAQQARKRAVEIGSQKLIIDRLDVELRKTIQKPDSLAGI